MMEKGQHKEISEISLGVKHFWIKQLLSVEKNHLVRGWDR